MSVFNSNKNRCWAISKNTNKRCKNNALKWSNYCFFHQSKRLWLLNMLLGGIIGYFISNGIDSLVISKDEKAKHEVIKRIQTDAAKTVAYTDLFFDQYLSKENDTLIQKIKAIKIVDINKPYSYYKEFIELEDRIMNLDFYSSTYTFNKQGTNLNKLSLLINYLNNTYQLTQDFMSRYGSFEHELVTVVLKLNRRSEQLVFGLSYIEKSMMRGEKLYDNESVKKQHVEFLTDYFYHQIMCFKLSNQNYRI